ncbi:uncharacterized protein YggE [Streptomyces olivoverticillatus]|uniref:Uncharacterized protein YggE n=1 Tax=Streptomyces olivoverticillatus TaxID=66427 RepID=A0A7W7LRT9_9ACTN|nr:hypothetical protein [Streptomyces olivoverticillatus]MBB4895284.1 uncharacterized protein YggE [Streptomyces olivoverticillatus]
MSDPGAAPVWSRPVREQAVRLKSQAERLRASAEGMTLPGPEGAALRLRVLAQADRAETAARSLERAAEALGEHEAVLAALARRRREGGGARAAG